jgi:radical SAM-linked protein
MIGLPTETEEDLQAIVNLVDRLRKIKGEGRRWGKINASFSTFIPKAHTPFQWASQLSLGEIKKRLEWLKKRLNPMRGVRVKWQKPEMSLLEGIFARGDRRLSAVLVNAYQQGCRFDGWNDQFDFLLWNDAFAGENLDMDAYLNRIQDPRDPLPWDHIDMGIEKAFLLDERKKALRGEVTADCRFGECHGCGVCDFETIEPKVNIKENRPEKPERSSVEGKAPLYRMICLTFHKKGPARFFGHLEMVNILIRAIKRSGIDVKYTQGFHPKPKVSFEDTLPLGMESENEKIRFFVKENNDKEKIMRSINRHLPDGLIVTEGLWVDDSRKKPAFQLYEYRIEMTSGRFDDDDLRAYHQKSRWIIERKNKKGKRKRIDLKKMIKAIGLESDRVMVLTLGKNNGTTLRPKEVIRSVFHLTEEQLDLAQIKKVKSNVQKNSD